MKVHPYVVGSSGDEDDELDPNSMANVDDETDNLQEKLSSTDTVVINGQAFVGKLVRFTVTNDKVNGKTTVKLVLTA